MGLVLRGIKTTERWRMIEKSLFNEGRFLLPKPSVRGCKYRTAGSMAECWEMAWSAEIIVVGGCVAAAPLTFDRRKGEVL